MTAADHGICIDCGQHTPLRLPRRFPHICTYCLFYAERGERDETASHQSEVGDSVLPLTIMEMLTLRARNAPLEIPFGKKATPRGPDDKPYDNV